MPHILELRAPLQVIGAVIRPVEVLVVDMGTARMCAQEGRCDKSVDKDRSSFHSIAGPEHDDLVSHRMVACGHQPASG